MHVKITRTDRAYSREDHVIFFLFFFGKGGAALLNYRLPHSSSNQPGTRTQEHAIMESREGRETGDRKRPARLRVGADAVGSGGGVRIEGVVVWGGTLAIASLMALFTIRAKKRDSSRCPSGPEKLTVKATEGGGGGGEGGENGGPRLVLQDQSSPTGPLTPRNSSCSIGGSCGGSSTTDLAHLDCCDYASGQSLTSEEEPAPIETDEGKEPHQDTVFSEELMAEVDESADSVEEEEEEEEDGGGGNDEQAEEVEGSSEESGDPFPELNAEAIWLLGINKAVKTNVEDGADMTKINKQENDSIIHEEGEEDDVGDDTSENPGDLTALSENGLCLDETVVGNHRARSFLRPSIWIWHVLLLLILLSVIPSSR